MTWLHYTEASGGLPNSGRLSGTDGDWVGIADVAFVAAGMAIEYSSGNARVYRPATGKRFRFCFNDAAAASGDARLCVYRMAENASSATSLTDPFPQTSQIADASSNLIKSSTANTTARNFDLFVSPTAFILFTNFSSTTDIWDWVAGGDVVSNLTGDTYGTVCVVRNSTSTSAVGNSWSIGSNTTGGSTNVRWARSYDGTTKSTTGGINMVGSGNLGQLTGAPAAQAGPSTGVDMEKITFLDTGSNSSTSMSTSLGLPRRGYFPNIWQLLHNGRGATIKSRDIWENNTYNPSAIFEIWTSGATAAVSNLVVETTDTWSAPSG